MIIVMGLWYSNTWEFLAPLWVWIERWLVPFLVSYQRQNLTNVTASVMYLYCCFWVPITTTGCQGWWCS